MPVNYRATGRVNDRAASNKSENAEVRGISQDTVENYVMNSEKKDGFWGQLMELLKKKRWRLGTFNQAFEPPHQNP